jgi:hypothetical protein
MLNIGRSVLMERSLNARSIAEFFKKISMWGWGRAGVGAWGVSPVLASPVGGYKSRPAARAASNQKVGIHVVVRRPDGRQDRSSNNGHAICRR